MQAIALEIVRLFRRQEFPQGSRLMMGSVSTMILLSYLLLPPSTRVVFGSVISVSIFLYLMFENKRLATQLEDQKAKLTHHILRFVELKSNLSEVESELRKIPASVPAPQLNRAIRILASACPSDKDWSEFESANTAFDKKLNAKFPNLTIAEQRLAALVNLKLTNREIASIFKIESTSVSVAKYRLKKKLGLHPDEDIFSFLRKFN